MFTGIVEDTGRIASCMAGPTLGTAGALGTAGGIVGARIVVETALDLSDTKLGDSISVDGCCLTVVEITLGNVAFDLGPETLAVTTLGALVPGSRVHLERAMKLSDRLGGHLVSGHVDAIGTVERRHEDGEALFLRIAAPAAVMRVSIHKGSVTVAGVSLTLNAVDDTGFEVCLIPHTLARTHLGELGVGSRVNLESDLLGKYVEKLLSPR